MSGRKSPLQLLLSDFFADAGHQHLRSDYVPQGKIWCIQRAAWAGDVATSGGETCARTYIESGAITLYIKEQDNPTANVFYTDPDPVYLVAGQRYGLEFDHGAASTTLKMVLLGYSQDAEGGLAQ